MLFFSTFSYALVHDREYIHAITYNVTCPNCGHSPCEMTGGSPITEATCTEQGYAEFQCPNCHEYFPANIPALGHDYEIVSQVKATCTKSGSKTYTCSRCGDTYTETVKALGHNYKSKITKPATCTEEGLKTYTCSRCGKQYTESIEPLGHDIDYEEKEATCTEDGIKEAVCKRCNETVQETIEKLGHDYPDEWTVEKEAGFFAEGLKVKICRTCGDRLEEAIPRKSSLPLLLGGAGGLAVLGGIFYFLRKSGTLGKKLVEDVTREAIKPSFETKTILTDSKDEKLVELLKKQHYLKVVEGEYEDLNEDAKENEPDLVIVDILSEERMDEILKKKKEEELKECDFGLVLSSEMLNDNKARLKRWVKDKKIVGYVEFGKDDYSPLVKLILPVLKPDIKSDETLENFGKIADALGIPGISAIISVYTSGRDIKSTLEEGELGVNETATIIGDIASILGLDQVESIAGLVGDVDSIKKAIDKDAGTHEEVSGVNAGKDIVEVVSDIVKKKQ